MNQTKLDVIRINEDVIATSSVCQHSNANHVVIISEKSSTEFNIKVYDCRTSTWYNDFTDKISFQVGTQPSDTKYYYIEPGVGFKLCEGSHDFSSYSQYIR